MLDDTKTASFSPGTMEDKRETAVDVSDSEQSGPLEQAKADAEYPQGLTLFLLAGASVMGVFLISLDQVSGLYRVKQISSQSIHRRH